MTLCIIFTSHGFEKIQLREHHNENSFNPFMLYQRLFLLFVRYMI